MKNVFHQKPLNYIYSSIAILYCTILFLWIFLTPSLPEERLVWRFSSERFILVIMSFSILLLALLSFWFYTTKLVKDFFDKALSSSFIFGIVIILLFVSLLYLTLCLMDLFGKYTHFSTHFLPVMILILCISSETFVFQEIKSNRKIGLQVWKSINSFELSKEKKLTILAVMLLIGFIAAIFVNYYRGYYQEKSYPYNTFLFDPDARFSDFHCVVNETIGMNPYGKFLSGQYPFLLLASSFFTLFKPEASYIIFILSFFIVYLSISYQFLHIENTLSSLLLVIIITIFSYPLMFSLDRGNFELLVFVYLLLFLIFFHKEKYLLSAIFLGLAAALKIYPAIFLLLFFKNKKFKESAITIGIMVGLSLISLSIFEGGLWKNLQYLLHFSNISNNPIFQSFISIEKETMVQRGLTILSLIKIIVQQYNIPVSDFVVQNYHLIYYVLVGVIFLPIAYYVVFIEKELWKNVALLTISMLILPTLSADYKLMHIYLALFLFINSKKPNRLDILYLVFFALLLIPKNYYYLQNVFSDSNWRYDISMAMPINISVLLFMAVAIMISGLIDRLKNKKLALRPNASS